MIMNYWLSDLSIFKQYTLLSGDPYVTCCVFLHTGDAVVYGKDTATVVIEANDDANGIFSLDATEKSVEEGKSNNF